MKVKKCQVHSYFLIMLQTLLVIQKTCSVIEDSKQEYKLTILEQNHFQNKSVLFPGQLTNEENKLIWENHSMHIKNNSKDVYDEINKSYRKDKTICISLDLDDFLLNELKPAHYNTLVVVGRLKNKPVEDFREIKLFLMLDHIIKSGVEIDRFVFYNIEEKGMEESPYARNNKNIKIEKSVKVVFHDCCTGVFNKVGEDLINRFSDIQIQIVSNNKSMLGMDTLKKPVLSSIAEIRMKHFPTTDQYGPIGEMKKLDSLWITGYTPSDLHKKNNQCSIYKGKIYINKLYMRIDALEYYLSNIFLFSSIIIPKDTFGIFIGKTNHTKKSALKNRNADVAYNLSLLPDSVKIEFIIEYTKYLVPSALEYILSLICKWNMHTRKIEIKNGFLPLGVPYYIAHMPKYYSARNIKDRKKLQKASIKIAENKNSSEKEYLKEAPYKLWGIDQNKDDILSNCNIIMKKSEFSKGLNSPDEILDNTEIQVKCLNIMKKKRISSRIRCMYCGCKIENDKIPASQDQSHIMLHTCGHASCATCGYINMTKEIKRDLKCMFCERRIHTVSLDKNNRTSKKIYSIVLLEKELSMKKGLNQASICSNFLFIYELSDRVILFTEADFLTR